jgi:hypothetical protein
MRGRPGFETEHLKKQGPMLARYRTIRPVE